MSARIETILRLAGALLVCVIAAGVVGVPDCVAEEPITLEEAIARALARNPLLAAQAMGAEAAQARVRQAGMRPNPQLAMEVEDFGGRGPLSEFQGAQLTVQIEQTLELGGKRGRRKRAEALNSGLASLDFEWQRRLLEREVAVRFAGVLAAQERLALETEIVELQREVKTAVGKRVAAGKDPPLEETRVQVELAEAELELRAAERGLEIARRGLAKTWGEEDAGFGHAVALDAQIQSPRGWDGLLVGLGESPLMSRWVLEEERAGAELSLARALRMPDLTLFGGVRHFKDGNERALVAGLAIPFPLFDRNQGGVQEATLQASMTRAERDDAEAQTRLDLREAHTRLIDAYAAVIALREEIVPAAERTFATALAGYRNGKFEYLLVLDAQRTLFAVRAREVEARENYFQAWADVQLLVGPSPVSSGTSE